MIDVSRGQEEIFTVKLDTRPKIFIEKNKSNEIEIILVGRSSKALNLRKGDLILGINGERFEKDLDQDAVEQLLSEEALPFTLEIKNTVISR